MTARSVRPFLCLVLLALLAVARPAAAQLDIDTEVEADAPVALIADRIDYDNNTGRVIASGSVEVYYGDRTLTADKIVYDRTTDRIEAEGNIVLRDPSGATVYASIADIDAKLRDGLVRGARSVLGTEGKLAAVEGRRIDQRYNALAKAVYSPCRVCKEDPTPLWRIRARRVIHDEEKKVIHYEDATFDLFGVPIAWTPYLSHPDPTVKRASGFLVPSVRQSGNYGVGLKTPYYWVIDDHSDATITPFITTKEGLIGELEYRRAFETGEMFVSGSATYTDYTGQDSFQGHVESAGLFRLEDEIKWGWSVAATSDDAYLRRFDFSNEDRLTSEVFTNRYRADGFFDLAGVKFQSLRRREPAGQIPVALPEFSLRQEFNDPWAGGEFGFNASSYGLFRNEGRDVGRLSIGADWERQETLPFGLQLTGFAEIRGDGYLIGDDPAFTDNTSFRLAPTAGVEARYPLIWEEADGASHVVEPIVQAIVAPYGGNGADIPNEDSVIVEFDETNLFARSHFSGVDGFEEGPRFNVGLRYERFSDDGIQVDATVGRVFRFRDALEFSTGSGLRQAQSDWVTAWGIGYQNYFNLRHRMRFDDEFSITRNEVQAVAAYGPATLRASYLFFEADPAIGVPSDREEVSAGASLSVNRNWSGTAYFQRDLENSEFVAVGGTIAYANECCRVELFVRRRFTSSAGSPASTSFGVQVDLLTLGTSQVGGKP